MLREGLVSRIGHLRWHFNRCAAHTLGDMAALAVLRSLHLRRSPLQSSPT